MFLFLMRHLTAISLPIMLTVKVMMLSWNSDQAAFPSIPQLRSTLSIVSQTGEMICETGSLC